MNNQPSSSMLQQLNIDTSQTPEKFQHLADEIIGFLIGHLKALNTLEREIFERSEVLSSKRTVSNQIHPDEEELWAEYDRRYKEMLEPVVLTPFKHGASSFGNPAKYDYLDYPDTKIVFIMKSASRVVMETEFEHGIKEKQQFVLKKAGDAWKIDTKKYGFPGDDTWWKCDL